MLGSLSISHRRKDNWVEYYRKSLHKFKCIQRIKKVKAIQQLITKDSIKPVRMLVSSNFRLTQHQLLTQQLPKLVAIILNAILLQISSHKLMATTTIKTTSKPSIQIPDKMTFGLRKIRDPSAKHKRPLTRSSVATLKRC